jgi:serine/threonine-protein kinase
VPIREVYSLGAEGKKMALLGAICYARAGHTTEAVELFVALSEHQRAAEVLQKAGDPVGAARVLASAGTKFSAMSPPVELPRGVSGSAVTIESARKLEKLGKPELAIQAYVQLKRYGEAGRVARQLGKASDAASFYAEAGLVFDAGTCYVEAGDSGKALENFIRLPRDDAQYRAACLEVVRLANDLNYVGLKMDHFLTRFIEEGPQTAREVECFYLLSKVFKKNDLVENAKEALRKILSRHPDYRDSAALLARLEQQTEGTPQQFDRILKDEASYLAVDLHGRHSRAAPAEGLPELPELPPLPAPAAPPHPVAVPTPRPGPRPPPEPIATEVSSDDRTGETLFRAGGTPLATHSPVQIGVGALLVERYLLQQEIGRGGMAVVFRALDQELGEQIAVKVFAQGLDDEQGLTRFRQELQLSRQLVHPNIVRLFDIGVFEGRRFISMELLVGSDLKEHLTRPWDEGKGVALLLQATAGLQVAHQLGIVHRDIKPENLFLTSEGVLKVMDFGIAKRQLAKGVTVAGMVAGTPEYMSPEQITNFTAVTPSTDLYALGVVAYEMFTGHVPFRDPELVPLLMMHINDAPPSPRSANPSLSEGLEQIILKLLQKSPDERFADCGELRQALEALPSSQPSWTPRADPY